MEPSLNKTTYTYDNDYYDIGIDGFHKKSHLLIQQHFEGVTAGKQLDHITDFGCGNGFHGRFLRTKTKKLSGLDYSDALKTSPNFSLYDEFSQCDLGVPLSENPLPSDLAFSVEVIEHVKDYRQFIRNANKVLSAGGTLFLTTTTYWQYLFIFCIVYRRNISFKAIAEFFAGLWGNGEKRTAFTVRLWEYCTGHYHGFSKKMLKKATRENGFRVTEIRYLFIEDIIPVHYLKQPYNGRLGFIIKPLIWILYGIGYFVNAVLRHLRLYGSNVLLVAEKIEEV